MGVTALSEAERRDDCDDYDELKECPPARVEIWDRLEVGIEISGARYPGLFILA